MGLWDEILSISLWIEWYVFIWLPESREEYTYYIRTMIL